MSQFELILRQLGFREAPEVRDAYSRTYRLADEDRVSVCVSETVACFWIRTLRDHGSDVAQQGQANTADEIPAIFAKTMAELTSKSR